ncbi:MAG: putative addiction module antidote protein [Candidatus Sedimenticola sp. (ex Thyasira tokunagai)]
MSKKQRNIGKTSTAKTQKERAQQAMMMNSAKTASYDPKDYLKTQEDRVEYLNAALEDGDERVLLMALRNVVKSMEGMTQLSRQTGLSRESLYRALSDNGNPRVSSFFSILHAIGMDLSIKPGQVAGNLVKQ